VSVLVEYSLVRQEAWTNDFRVDTESRDDRDGHVIRLFSCSSDYTLSSEKYILFLFFHDAYTSQK